MLGILGLILCLSVVVDTAASVDATPLVVAPSEKTLPLPGTTFQLDGGDAFVILPDDHQNRDGIAWVWYAPTLRGLPSDAEVGMFKQLLDRGIAIAGIDVGESYGSPDGREAYTRFYTYAQQTYHLGPKPCLLARSRGGLMLLNWAAEHPDAVAGIAGIYPVCNLNSYPGLAKACEAYGMTEDDLRNNLTKENPVDRLAGLADADIPILTIHGDVDHVVPLIDNSELLRSRYAALGGNAEVIVVPGQGHNMWEGFFKSQALTDFMIKHALGKTTAKRDSDVPTPEPISHWRFDVNDGVAIDSAGGHEGTVVGATETVGRIGKALEFVRDRGDHVRIDYDEDFALSTFSVSAWVYLTQPPTFSGILGTRHGTDNTFDMKVNDAKVHGDIGTGETWIQTGVNFYADDTGTNGRGGALDLNRWYHIVYVIDNAANECQLYLDADLKKRIYFEGNPLLMKPTQMMHIGHSSGTEFMDGKIDELKIWNVALTPQQVESDYQLGQPFQERN